MCSHTSGVKTSKKRLGLEVRSDPLQLRIAAVEHFGQEGKRSACGSFSAPEFVDHAAPAAATFQTSHRGRDMTDTFGRSALGTSLNPARAYARMAGSLPAITFNRSSEAPSDLA